MTPISLMPPVDYCPSCEGRKAENHALQVGEARARQAELQSAAETPAPPAAGGLPGDAPSAATTGDRTTSVTAAVQPLLAPGLTVQASLGSSAAEAGGGADEALRLRAAQAYAGG